MPNPPPALHSALRTSGEELPHQPLCVTEDSRQHTRDLLRRVGDTWSLVVVSQLVDGPRRFTELMRALPDISHRMLAKTLRTLNRDGLVSRTSYPEVPPRVEYDLTPLGHTLLIPLNTLTTWAETHSSEMEDNRTRFDQAQENKHKPHGPL
ncbi:winged helix-turn-helix transcriptional regulator [Actinophytocola xinjiangensis]|uniref:winged helix-turn-helix transcriptional regulator n=1 Tax=Actinophytocola xinjiangensis TaxID=485602 RepID=UPI000A05B8C1|nr:helix-turn-helix domain-containing protein [Actinophytocola xinjiangensis]